MTADRVLRYLGSTRNIVGCVLALVGFGAHFLGLAGTFWPVVVVGLYGVGALLAPPDRVRLAVSHAEVETTALRADLEALLRKVDGSQRFPEDVRARLGGLADVLGGVLGRAEVLTTSPTTCTSSLRRSATTFPPAWSPTPTCPAPTPSPAAPTASAAPTRNSWPSSTCWTPRCTRWPRPYTGATSRPCATRAVSCATASAAPAWTSIRDRSPAHRPTTAPSGPRRTCREVRRLSPRDRSVARAPARQARRRGRSATGRGRINDWRVPYLCAPKVAESGLEAYRAHHDHRWALGAHSRRPDHRVR
ncbi:hypothetical protein ACFQX6_28745 [Streptosporangium lutulentum]